MLAVTDDDYTTKQILILVHADQHQDTDAETFIISLAGHWRR